MFKLIGCRFEQNRHSGILVKDMCMIYRSMKFIEQKIERLYFIIVEGVVSLFIHINVIEIIVEESFSNSHTFTFVYTLKI